MLTQWARSSKVQQTGPKYSSVPPSVCVSYRVRHFPRECLSLGERIRCVNRCGCNSFASSVPGRYILGPFEERTRMVNRAIKVTSLHNDYIANICSFAREESDRSLVISLFVFFWELLPIGRWVCDLGTLRRCERRTYLCRNRLSPFQVCLVKLGTALTRPSLREQVRG